MARQNYSPKAKKVSTSKPTVVGFLPFGEGDMLPQTLIDVIDDSDTATAAVQARAEFIIGDGIKDELLADMVVNRQGETLDEVAEGMAWNIAYGEVICLLIGYNGNAQVISVRSVSWEMIRLAIPDANGNLTHGAVFPYLDNTFKKDQKKDHTLLPLFDPTPEVVLAQMAAVGGIQNYYGQLLYVKVGRPSADYYSIPWYFGSVKNLETEHELTEFDFSTVINGFNVSGVWKQLKSEVPSTTEDINVESLDPVERRRYEREREAEDADSFEARLSDMQGGENAGKILVAYASDVQELEAMGFESTSGTDLSNRYSATSERVAQRIARRFRVPNEIVNLRKQGGIAPTGEEMKVASQVMQQSVNKYQRRIDQVLAKVLAYWHEALPSSNDFELGYLNYFTDATATPTAQSNGNNVPTA